VGGEKRKTFLFFKNEETDILRERERERERERVEIKNKRK
jgi:hypothetical protein